MKKDKNKINKERNYVFKEILENNTFSPKVEVDRKKEEKKGKIKHKKSLY